MATDDDAELTGDRWAIAASNPPFKDGKTHPPARSSEYRDFENMDDFIASLDDPWPNDLAQFPSDQERDDQEQAAFMTEWSSTHRAGGDCALWALALLAVACALIAQPF